MCVCVSMSVSVCSCTVDMGMGQIDGSLEPIYSEQYPSLNTTQLIMNELNKTDLVLHIGDISYARGFAGVVSWMPLHPLPSLSLSGSYFQQALIAIIFFHVVG